MLLFNLLSFNLEANLTFNITMKKTFLTLALAVASYCCYAQTYLPLTAGSGSPLTGTLYSNITADGVLIANNAGTNRLYQLLQGTNAYGLFGIEGSTVTMFTGATAYATVIGSKNVTPLQLGTNGVVYQTITSSGNVGIGTTSPSQVLSVNGNIEITPSTAISKALLFTTPSSNWGHASSGVYFTPRDGVNATTDFAINLWDGTSGTPEWGTTPTRLFIDAASGDVGVGTTSPLAPLQVQTYGSTGGVQLGSWVGGSTVGAIYLNNDFSTANNYNFLSGPSASLYINRSSGGNILFREGNGIDQMVIAPGGNVGIGTTTPDTKLAVNGTIHSKEVKVDLTGWPDYVFNSKYDLPSLLEVKTYVDQNQHLPDMPSAQEVKDNGINLGEMNKLLTKKVEELTLYMIDKDMQVNNLQDQVNQLKEQLNLITKTLTKN
jgi:hypothetical protein